MICQDGTVLRDFIMSLSLYYTEYQNPFIGQQLSLQPTFSLLLTHICVSVKAQVFQVLKFGWFVHPLSNFIPTHLIQTQSMAVVVVMVLFWFCFKPAHCLLYPCQSQYVKLGL